MSDQEELLLHQTDYCVHKVIVVCVTYVRVVALPPQAVLPGMW